MTFPQSMSAHTVFANDPEVIPGRGCTRFGVVYRDLNNGSSHDLGGFQNACRLMDLGRHGSDVQWPEVSREALGREPRLGADTPWVHRRPGYSLAGGFPAEPASASPGNGIAAGGRISMQPLDIGIMPWKNPPVYGHPPKESNEPKSRRCHRFAATGSLRNGAYSVTPPGGAGALCCSNLSRRGEN